MARITFGAFEPDGDGGGRVAVYANGKPCGAIYRHAGQGMLEWAADAALERRFGAHVVVGRRSLRDAKRDLIEAAAHRP